ncbi:MAG: hypothetical protein HC904_04030 [Blastochloris sp.]|nr:hypothetical protein [Blastochloris sp.]
MGALAIGDLEPELAGEVLMRARKNNPLALGSYAPDGVGYEGPGYWSYGTTYQVLLATALQSALGQDWDLSKNRPLLESASFVLQTTGPTGLVFNFSDGREKLGVEPALYWFARQRKEPGLLAFEFDRLDAFLKQEPTPTSLADTSRFLPLIALWWTCLKTKPEPELPLSWMGRGDQPLAVFRSAWVEPGAMWLAIKGGSAQLSHAQMDAGTFVFEADGERWASDLGLQDYFILESKSLSLWDRKQDSDRWKVFRLNSDSHSVLTINGQQQRVEGKARIVRFSDEKDVSTALIDLRSIYQGLASKVSRGVAFRPGHQVLLRDELEGLKAGDKVRWAMVTKAALSMQGQEVELTQNGKKLRVKVLAPAGARFESLPAEPPPDDFNQPNPGFQLLTLNLVAPETGTMEIEVLLVPGSATEVEETLAGKSLEQWPGEEVKAH